jgi:hypothetical protein
MKLNKLSLKLLIMKQTHWQFPDCPEKFSEVAFSKFSS